MKSLTRQKAANGKLQGFGFLEFQEPDAVARALKLLQGKTIPAQEPDQPNKALVVCYINQLYLYSILTVFSLQVRADDKVKAHLQAYEATRLRTDVCNRAIDYLQP